MSDAHGDPECKTCGGTEPLICDHCIEWIADEARKKRERGEYVARVVGQRAQLHRDSGVARQLVGEPTWDELMAKLKSTTEQIAALEQPDEQGDATPRSVRMDEAEEFAVHVMDHTDSRDAATLAGMVLGLVSMLREGEPPEQVIPPANELDVFFQKTLERVPEESEGEAVHGWDTNQTPLKTAHASMDGDGVVTLHPDADTPPEPADIKREDGELWVPNDEPSTLVFTESEDDDGNEKQP